MIYLDHNATSPLLAEVVDAMAPWFGVPANPASAHSAGQRAYSAVERAREEVARLVGGNPAGVVFTSGATEANHLFLRGVPRPGSNRRPVCVSAVEHPCVWAAVRLLASLGAPILEIPVGKDGIARLDQVPEDAALLSLMAANHETGVIQPIDAAIAIAEAIGAPLHVDATQAAGRIPLALGAVDGVVLSSHKIGGPGGVGCLILRDGEPFPALLTGGSQERGRRAGSVNVAGIIGFAEACRLARVELADRSALMNALSGRIREGVLRAGGRLVGDRARTLPNTTCAIFPGISGEAVVQALDLRGLCVSSGAACSSGSLEPSPVLRAMGDPEPRGGVRFSVGPRTLDADVDALLAALGPVLEGLRTEAELAGSPTGETSGRIAP